MSLKYEPASVPQVADDTERRAALEVEEKARLNQVPHNLSFPPWRQPRANLESISHRFHPILVAFAWELTIETIDLPLGCLQGGIYYVRTCS